MTDLYDRLSEAAETLASLTGKRAHDVGVILGSGLGDCADRFGTATTMVPYADLPGFPQPGAVGHRGTAYSVEAGDRDVLLLAGRIHAYEGHPMETVTFPVRTAVVAGCRSIVITNAAGGVGEGIEPGDLVLLTDHINLGGISPLAGANDERIGPRFPDMSQVYSPSLRQKAKEAGQRSGVALKEGVYLWWHGPMYETPAEIRMVAALGADLVGMSTVPEATAAAHMGSEVLGISLCTNRAAGLSAGRLSSEEVIATANAAAGRFGDLLDELLPTI